MGKTALAEYRARRAERKREGGRPGPRPGSVAGTSSHHHPPRLARFFALIEEHDRAGLPWPTTREFAAHMGWNPLTAHDHRRVMLRSCLDRGWIVRQGDGYAVVGANLAAHLIRLGWRPEVSVAKPGAGR